ncbi:MAG: hypothetical protein P8L18_02095 [Verrucomicrobiota bacterium]|nr:hypothetical protein [Verrucomicrobiota bacterium]
MKAITRNVQWILLLVTFLSFASSVRAQTADPLLDSLTTDPGSWSASPVGNTPVQFQRRFFMDAAGWNGRPVGLWSNGTTLYVIDWLFSKIFAYHISGARDHAHDINTLSAAGNRTPRGIWSDGVTLWVADDFEDRVFAYLLADGQRVPEREFDTLVAAGNLTPSGMWSDGNTMWISDDKDEKIYAYSLASTTRTPSLDIDHLGSHGNHSPRDLWSNGTTLWVADTGAYSQWGGWVYGKIFAYDLATRTRDASKDFDYQSLREAGATSPSGLWSNGSTLWVSDWRNHQTFASSLAGPVALENSPDESSRESQQDWDSLAESGNVHPSGVWSDGARLWISDLGDNKIYAYDSMTGERVESKDFSSETLEAAGNGSPSGIWSNGFTMYVCDDLDDKVYAYDLNVQIHVPHKEINTLEASGNNWPRGMWSDGGILWIGDWEDDKLYAYDMSSNRHVAEHDFNTLAQAGNQDPSALWSDGSTMWVADWVDDMIYAYDMVSKERMPTRDFEILKSTGNRSPSGMWSDGRTLWVSDFADARLYGYWLSKEPPPNVRHIGRHADGQIMIQYRGTLMSSEGPVGPFIEVPGASSPLILKPEAEHRFFIAR